MARCSGVPGISRRKIPRSSAYTISKKAILFRHPDYDPDQAQKLINSSMSRHLSTRNISSKSMHAFLSNLANRQTDKHGQKHVPPPLSEVNKFNQSNKFTAYIAPYVASISETEMPKVVDWLAELLTLSTEVAYIIISILN